MARGEGFSSPTDLPSGPSAWAPPAYPCILAGVFKLTGVYTPLSAWIMLAFNSLCSALTCWTLYAIGFKVYNPVVARASAWTWALFPYAIYWPVRVVWEMSLSAFLLSLAFLMTLRMKEKARTRDWILFGLLWGLIALTNTAILSLLPCFLLWLLYPHPRHHVMPAVLSLLIMCATITPWIVRNYVVFGKFVFIRDNLPLEMHMANNERSGGLWTRSEHPGNDPEAMRQFQELGEIGFMQVKQQEVNRFIREHPARFAVFTLERIVYFWIGPPQADYIAGYDLRLARHVLFFLPAIFAFAGMCLTLWQRNAAGLPLACFLLVYPLPYYLVNPFPRYKHAVEPEMILLAVYLFWAASQKKMEWRKK